MEVSLVGQQAILARSELFPIRSQAGWFCDSKWSKRMLVPSGPSRIGFDLSTTARTRKREPAVRLAIRSVMAPEAETKADTRIEPTRRWPVGHSQLFVGLPLDAVSDCNTINHAKAIAAGLKALKLLGADGVELPLWWGIVEKDAMGKYDWSGYLALASMIRDVGLQLRVSLYFHASRDPAIPLPQWVSKIGEADPDIFFSDRAGKRYRECLSLAVDNLPVLNGKTPINVFEDFCMSFRTHFSDFLGSTITDIQVGLGPDGELKYPSFPYERRNHQATGVGEFQCYDKHMLEQLKQHAEATGNQYWGLSGPHDVPQYDQSPDSGNFFKEIGGSWETPYGDFFLTWYSNQLVSHGSRLLSIASKTFGDDSVTISGKVPLMHSWYKTRAHSSELTSGFYNTVNRDGYNAVAEMFAKNSCRMVLPGMDLSDKTQPQVSRSSPESLLSQIMAACKKNGLRVSGENSSVTGASKSFSKIKENLLREGAASEKNVMQDSFTYQRMGAYFFSPEHWPLFSEFVRSLKWPQQHSDDLPANEEEKTIPLTTDSLSGNSRQMLAV